MKKSSIFLLLFSFLTACGSGSPTILQTAIADEQTTLASGESKSYSFTVDTDAMVDPALLISAGSADTTSRIAIIVLTEAAFSRWDANESYEARFETIMAGSNLDLPISLSGIYRVVISNRSGMTPVTYVISADLFWQSR